MRRRAAEPGNPRAYPAGPELNRHFAARYMASRMTPPDDALANGADRIVMLHYPRTLVFGAGCARRLVEDAAARGSQRLFVVSGPSTGKLFATLRDPLGSRGMHLTVWDQIAREPTVAMFRAALSAARDARPDTIVGFGGGSPMDVAKLVAALLRGSQDISETFGIGKLAGRSTHLVCIPTTAGTGSEVSPNAVLLDEAEQLKKAVISPHLVPDAAYVDPMLTIGVPPAVTAATGMDALTHCIEAYANKFAHPFVDAYALEGIRQIARQLDRAVERGGDVEARTAVALGSLYGGMCLGPVNTAAVHALAYPLGSEFHVPHGVSNAVLLPHVLQFNLPGASRLYADVAVALGAERGDDDQATALRGLDVIRDLSRRCGIPARMTQLGVPPDAVERMARSAMKVTRLLERNVRDVTLADAVEIYRRAM